MLSTGKTFINHRKGEKKRDRRQQQRRGGVPRRRTPFTAPAALVITDRRNCFSQLRRRMINQLHGSSSRAERESTHGRCRSLLRQARRAQRNQISRTLTMAFFGAPRRRLVNQFRSRASFGPTNDKLQEQSKERIGVAAVKPFFYILATLSIRTRIDSHPGEALLWGHGKMARKSILPHHFLYCFC